MQTTTVMPLRQVNTTRKRLRIASCDPCRASKLACDHVQPVCSRCQRKGISSECIYRENPFKRSRPSVVSPSSGSERFSSPIVTASSLAQTRLYPNPGFLGSSSFNAVVHEIGDQNQQCMTTSLSPENTRANREFARAAAQTSQELQRVQNGADVLGLVLNLRKLNTMKTIFAEWRGHGSEQYLGSTCATLFQESFSTEIAKIEHSSDQMNGAHAMSLRLFENGTKGFDITNTMSVREFYALYTGSDLRWETVGIIITFIGMAAIENRHWQAIDSTEVERQRLISMLVEASDTCLIFCETFDNLNDMHIMLLHLNFLLHSMFDGDQSFKTWRRLHDAVSALFALGLHEELLEGPKTPFFLVQLRKRIFARIYGADISFATFLGRPPRISKRFCFIHVPLDLEEQAYEYEKEKLDEEMQWINEHGWNTKGEIRKHASRRWSMMLAMIREDILEVLLGRHPINVPDTIARIRIECDEAWNTLPNVLKCSRDALWHSGYSPKELDTLILVKLFYLHTIFLAERALSRHTQEISASSLTIAYEMLCWVNDVTIRRDRLSSFAQTSFAWRVASFALPAAGVLALNLLRHARNIIPNEQETVSRTQVIEGLSVLTAHLDVLFEPGDGNYQLFCEAKQVLQSILDIVITPIGHRQIEDSFPGSATGFSAGEWANVDQWGFDSDFWSNLGDHPLLAPDMYVG